MSTSSVIAEAEFSEIVQAQGTKTADGRDWGSAVTSYTGCIESRDPGHCCPPDLDSNTLRQQASYSFRPTRPGDRFARAYLSVFSRSLVFSSPLLSTRDLTFGMASTTVNVVRYTALLSGVFYGITHRRSLQKAHDAEVKHHAIHEREHLIEEAKEAWKRKQQGSKDGVITDPEDPRFDLEKLIAKWEDESK